MLPQRAGLAVEMYGMGVAVGDYDNDGFPDLLVTAVGQNRLFHNNGKRPLYRRHGKGRAGRAQRLQHVGDVVRLRSRRPARSVRLQLRAMVAGSTTCSAASTASTNRTARPRRIAASTCWLFRNRGNGTFEDVTAKSGIFDTHLEIARAWP